MNNMMSDNKKFGDIILLFVIIVIVLSVINILVIYLKILEFNKNFTGDQVGYVNFTIMTSLLIDITRDTIDWGSGTLNGSGSEQFNATLYTDGDNPGVVLRGNWSNNVSGFIVANVGSINSSIYIQNSKNASDMFGSFSGTNEEYKVKVTEKDVGSCSGNTGVWVDANKSAQGTLFCSSLGSGSSNEIYVDILLTVPYDITNLGTVSDIITITADAVI